MRRTSPALSPSSDSSLVSLDSAASAMTSRPPTPVAKAITTSTDEVKQQTTTFYASTLPQHRSLMDVPGRCSPQPPRYSSRPHSPPTSSPSVEPKVNGSGATDGRANGYDYQSPSSREGEHELRREQSPLPRIVSTDSATPSATVGFLELALGSYSVYTRRALSPRPMLGNRSRSGEASAPTSFDSEHLRSISRGSNGTSSHQRSNSAEGQQGYKRWGPYTSPVPIHRMQQKPYVPTNLSGKETNNGRQSPPSQLSSIPSQESRRVSDSDRMNVDEGGEVDSAQHAGSKRKDREEEAGGEKRANDQTEVAASLSRFSTLAPPSSHLYSNMEKARQERNSAIDDQRKGRQASEGAQEQDELEDDDSDEARNRATRTVDGVVHALVPQRKSCDRCFKMKTKCSRAAPGASGEEPCDGCVRRGYGDDCVTSRPDYPYPRISLSKRVRRESSLPALLDLNNKDEAVFVPPSMQRASDWRSKVIVNSMQRGSEAYSRSSQQQRQTVQHHSMAEKRSLTPQPLPLRSHPSQYSSHPSSAWKNHQAPLQSKDAPSSNASRSHVSHLRSLPTSELQDLSISIAHEVTQRSQPPPLPMTTSLVPSITVPRQGEAVPQQHQGNASRLLPPSGGSLGQQAMQNAPMQLLPKATGLPALHYFDQFIYPLFSLSALSATVLQQKHECYIKPGRNNILELAMAIGLQLQGILLACPDKGQANTAEGRIFKAFLQTSRQQPEQRQQQGGDKSGSSQNDVSKVSIDSVKGWIEPARHRSRAKDIVKHVMMRRCLKSGFDYDDVIETSLLGYYHLLRGDVSGFHVCIGNTQRQLALLDIQQNPRDAALWSKQDMRVLQAKATAMDHLHPIKFYSRVGSSTSTSKDEQIVDNDFALVQEKLSELASFVQSASLQVSEGNSLDVEVDNRLSTLRRDLPDRLQQPTICSEWITTTCERVDSDWISDMIRGDSMTPSLRLNVYLNICFVRLVARQRHLLRALDATEKQEGSSSTPLESGLLKSIRQVDHISTSMISSTLLAFTVFPHLICLSQLFAAELTASAWNYIVAQLVLLDSASNEQRQVMQEGLKKMEDKLTPLIEYLAASQEKESWPFAASLGMVRSIIQAARESEAGARECLDTLRRFNIAHSQAFSRILKGNACAVEELRKQTMSTTIATDKDNDNNNKKTATIPP